MKDLNKYGFNGVSIHFTATCNLKCKYCFQPKLNSMSENNKKIIDWIRSGYMENDILKYFGPDIEYIQLWGGETAINLPYLVDRLSSIYSKFTKLTAINYSTNISTKQLAKNTVDTICKIHELNKSFNRSVQINVQFSIDGPPEVNDKDRIGSSAVEIMENITYVLKSVRSIYEEAPGTFRFSSKSTMSADTLRWYLEPNETYGNNLIYHFMFFNEYMNEWKEFCNYYPIMGNITLVNPGGYNKEDGKVLYEVQKILYSDELRNIKEIDRRSIITKYERNIIAAYDYIKYFNGQLNSKMALHGCNACSATRNCLGLSYDGKYHWCHHTFFFNEKDNKSIVDNNLTSEFEKIHGYSFRNFDNYIKDLAVIPADNDLLLLRSLNITDNFRYNLATRVQYLSMMIKELASSNLIDPCFLEDKWQNAAISYLLWSGNSCIVQNLWEFGSVYISSVSQLILLFNGTFQLIVENFNKYRGLK